MKFKPFVQTLAKMESGEEEVNIAQLSETVKKTLRMLDHMEPWEALKFIAEYGGGG